ncbi:MAG: glycosyltransferase 87 family protein, partial [Anaerolineae bacterium]
MDHNANHRQPSKTRQAGPLPNRLRHHGDILLILVLFVAFRLMALVVFRPGGYLGEMGDLGYYRLLLGFANQGFLPVVDFWMEYPPIFPWLMLGIYRLSLLIPPWSVPGTWFYLLLGTVLTIAAAGNLLLLYNLARRLVDQKQAVRLSWIYAVLLVPLLTIFIGFDGLALLALLWAVLLTLDRRPVASGIATGLGFMTKLVPIAAAPAALMHLPRLGSRAKYVAALALTILLIALPFLIAGPDYLAESLISPVKRSTWETPWALIDGYFSFGVAGGPDRFDPAQSGAAQHPTRLPWLAITGGFIVFYLYIWMRAGPRLSGGDNERTTGRRVVAFVALTQNLLTLYFKGYSPQILVMLLPF